MEQNDFDFIPKPVNSVAEYINAVLDWKSADSSVTWYRGIDDCEQHDLVPSAKRKPMDEESMFIKFMNEAPTYLDKQPINEWDWYFLARHYCLPTRLLDWTEMPLAALFFALDSYKEDDNKSIPCVWLLKPTKFNRELHGFNGIVAPESGGFTNHWLPKSLRGRELPTPPSSWYKSQPFALFPIKNNPRIVAQRGVFTIHGTHNTGLNKIRKITSTLGRIIINPDGLIQYQLKSLGINKTALFPELENVAKDVVNSM